MTDQDPTARERPEPAAEREQEPPELQRDTARDPAGSGSDGLSTDQLATLLRMLRVAYPHPSFPDAPYERTAKSVLDADTEDLLATGLDALDAAAGGDFRALTDEQATAAIQRIATTPFFKLVHSTTVVTLYDDHEVWDLLGYEGSSFDKGGYIDRGFDDLQWLPTPRITENTERRVEIVPGNGAQR